MKKILDAISEEMRKAFAEAGYDEELGKVSLSNRPDLCEYQCNGAMAGAKKYHKAPIMIAGEVAEKLKDSAVFSEVNAVAPGFLNLKVSDVFLCDYLKGMEAADKFGLETPEEEKTVIVDYGGPNGGEFLSMHVICNFTSRKMENVNTALFRGDRKSVV